MTSGIDAEWISPPAGFITKRSFRGLETNISFSGTSCKETDTYPAFFIEFSEDNELSKD